MLLIACINKTAEFQAVVEKNANFNSAESETGLSTVPKGTTVTCHRVGPDKTPPSQLARVWACLKAVPNTEALLSESGFGVRVCRVQKGAIAREPVQSHRIWE